jgi:hypothetical protein
VFCALEREYKKKGGYSLIGKTAILHIVILGSSPNISIYLWLQKKKCIITLRAKYKAREAQPGRAEL